MRHAKWVGRDWGWRCTGETVFADKERDDRKACQEMVALKMQSMGGVDDNKVGNAETTRFGQADP